MHVIDAAMTSHFLPSNHDPRKVGLGFIANKLGRIVSVGRLSGEYAKKCKKKAHGGGRWEVGETCTQGHNKGGRAEGIIMPETLGRTGEGKVFSVFENYHLPDVTISKQIELSSF